MVKIEFPRIPTSAGKDFQGKIVIIGAGVAGLSAANTLRYLGVDNYIVLEASDRVGGRIKSCDNFHADVPLDVGAEWIHHKDEQMVKDMLLFPHDDKTDLLPDDFLKYDPELTSNAGGNVKIFHWLYQETKWKRSTWWHWLHKHLYSHVKEHVKLNSPVVGIEYGTSKKVKVLMANDEELTADKVICTVPLAVLKKGNVIKFNPPLPDKKRQAIEAINMPAGFRILFEMKSKFYQDLKLVNGTMEQLWDGNDLAAIYDALYGKELDSQQHILAYIAVGSKNAGAMGSMEDEDLAKAALAKIDELYDGQGSLNHIRHVVQNWTLEPYVLGSYTFPGPRRYRKELRRAVQGQILFAGEHTSDKYYSLVPGAALEGRRAAVEAVSL